MKVTEGYMPFKGYQTYYRIVGTCEEGKSPLLLMHGGPGSTHNYFEVLDEVAKTGRAVISYDQIGCGNSFVEGRKDLWHQQTWVEELKALREHLGLEKVHLLGQSWGGMLAICYACDEKPEGIQSIILSSANPSSSLWAKEQHRMIRWLPDNLQKAIQEAEQTGDFSSEEYQKANDLFMERHCAGEPDAEGPECLLREKKTGKEVYLQAWGPSEFNPTGTLKGFEYLEKMNQIDIPTLVISGIDDLCTPVIAKKMYDILPRAKWELFEKSRHMPFVEEPEKYKKVLEEWLEQAEQGTLSF